MNRYPTYMDHQGRSRGQDHPQKLMDPQHDSHEIAYPAFQATASTTIPSYTPRLSFEDPSTDPSTIRNSQRRVFQTTQPSQMPTLTQQEPPLNDFESRVRGLILNHASGLSPLESQSRDDSPRHDRGQISYRRPNQAQRRQEARNPRPTSLPNQSGASVNTHAAMPEQAIASSIAAGRSSPYPPQGSHSLHGKLLTGSSREPDLRRMPVLSHPPPYMSSIKPRPLRAPEYRSTIVSLGAQIAWLDQLAVQKVAEVQITPEEFAIKEKLRSKLQDICRTVIPAHERQKNAAFDESSVELKMFGSLATGFATRDSDMDLILLSPRPKSDPCSSPFEVQRLLEQALMEAGFGARLLTQTRVPIIKFCERPGHELAGALRFTRLEWEYSESVEVRQARAAKVNTSRVRQNQAISLPQEKSDPSGGEFLRKEVQLEKSPSFPEKLVDVTSASARASRSLEDTQPLLDVSRQSDYGRPPKVEEDAMSNEVEAHALADTRDQQLESSIDGLSVSDQAAGKSNEHSVLGKEMALELRPSYCASKYADHELIGMISVCCRHPNTYTKDDNIRINDFIQAFKTKHHPHQRQELDLTRKALYEVPRLLIPFQKPARDALDYPKTGVGIQCDINFSNELALHNSKLLKCYCLCDPRVQVIVLFVKAWTKTRKINSPYHGTMNSYGYVLMVLHYLMNVAKPPVIPNLQRLASHLIENDPISNSQRTFEGYNVSFFRNEDEIRKMSILGKMTDNQDSVGSLIRGFFQYFAQPPTGGFRWKDDALSLRTTGGILTKASKGWLGARRETVQSVGSEATPKTVNHHYVVAIEDPFEIEHNVARTVVFHGIIAIRNEFRRAMSLIVNAGGPSGNGMEDFFAKGKKNENLQRRPGGPKEHSVRR